jgi:hypothetical protein
VPQLSCLAYGQPPPVSSEAFREKAAPILDEKDAALMALLSLDLPSEEGEGGSPKAGCDFIDGWREWEKALRLNLARLRASGLGLDLDDLPEAPVLPSGAAAAAARALEAETPLEGEIAIDRARWDAIEALQGGELFHRRTVFAYLMKLLILERQALFQAEAGFSEYTALYKSIRSGEGRQGATPMGESK